MMARVWINFSIVSKYLYAGKTSLCLIAFIGMFIDQSVIVERLLAIFWCSNMKFVGNEKPEYPQLLIIVEFLGLLILQDWVSK